MDNDETDMGAAASVIEEAVTHMMASVYESKNEHAVECDPIRFTQALAKMSRTVRHMHALDESYQKENVNIKAQFYKLRQYEELHSKIKELASVFQKTELAISENDRDIARSVYIGMAEIEKGEKF